MKLRGPQAELVRLFKPGYRIQPAKSGHAKIIGPDDKPVRVPGSSQPLMLATSPAANGTHYMKRISETLKDAGVIERDQLETLLQERASRAPLELPETNGHANGNGDSNGYTFFTPIRENPLPEVVLNLTWDEYLAMEEVVGLVLSKGPRAAAKLGPYLRLVERARIHMERKIT